MIRACSAWFGELSSGCLRAVERAISTSPQARRSEILTPVRILISASRFACGL
jgi:hypothetical protein